MSRVAVNLISPRRFVHRFHISLGRGAGIGRPVEVFNGVLGHKGEGAFGHLGLTQAGGQINGRQ